jgi:hypothetical protein
VLINVLVEVDIEFVVAGKIALTFVHTGTAPAPCDIKTSLPLPSLPLGDNAPRKINLPVLSTVTFVPSPIPMSTLPLPEEVMPCPKI